MKLIALVAVATLLTSCIETNSEPEALHLAFESGGAKVVYDLDARPFPEIPFPNDLATKIDPTSPTGRRLNVSLLGASAEEDRVREYINRMAGFGIITPMWVRFTKLLDLQNIVDRHQEDVPNFDDDAVYLVNVDRDSPEFGQFELIDFGRGNYPVLMEQPSKYFPNDPRVDGTNLVFESVAETDSNGNGVFDPIEDTDDDDVMDVPNLLNLNADPYEPGNTLEWYERETDSLIIRNVMPLEKKTTYAIVLSDKLVDAEGFPVDSPFEGINHTRQTEDLEPLREILPNAFPHRFDDTLKNVRFAWTFTTGDPTSDLQTLRAGLYGEGPFAYLENDYPADLHMVHNLKKPGADEPLTFDITVVADFVLPLFQGQISAAAAQAIRRSYDDMDYIVSGSYISPYFLVDKDGLADTGVKGASLEGNPQDDDEAWDLNFETGEGPVGEDEVTFVCSVPKTIPGVREPPFNTMIYSHAISTTRLEVILFGGAFAKFGFAMCVIDAVGHGVAIPPEFTDLVQRATESLDIPNFGEMINHHRARDLDNDGFPESGAAYFTSDLLHARDNMRQTAVDQLQLVRILRSWDGNKTWPAEKRDSPYFEARPNLASDFDQTGNGEPEIAGDFNGDGIVDFGGNRPYVGMGTSLGGLQTGILGALEPMIVAAGNNAGGGALADVALRTTISNVVNGAVLRMMGPTLLGFPFVDDDGPTGDILLAWILASGIEDVIVPFGVLEGVEDGYRVVLRNLDRETREVIPEEDLQEHATIRGGRFRVALSSDAMGGTKRRAMLGFDPTVSVQDDLMGCRVRGRCGDTACPAGEWTCSKEDENVCIPIRQCIWDFSSEDFASNDEIEAELKDQFALRTINGSSEFKSTDFGDSLVIEVYDENGELLPDKTITTFPENLVFENILYEKGTPLAALSQGFGLKRQTPTFRKFMAIAQLLLEVADPGVWATHYLTEPLSFPYEDPQFQDGTTDLLMMPTIGDQVVPINNSIAIARMAGLVDVINPIPGQEFTQNQFLANNFVYEGVYWFDRFQEFPMTLFDPDDMDNGQFGLVDTNGDDQPDAPTNRDARVPLRATQVNDGKVSGLRFAYLNAQGAHTFNAPLPDLTFDNASYFINMVGWYLLTSADEIRDDEPCLEQLSMEDCDFVDFQSFEVPQIQPRKAP